MERPSRWFLYFLKRSLSQRRGRFVIAAAAVLLSTAVVTALATLSLGIRDKIGAELKQYGANMIVTDRNGREIPAEIASAIRSLERFVKDSSFQVYGTSSAGGEAVEIIGAEPAKMRGYRIYGKLPQNDREAMVGINLKDRLKARQGERLLFGASGELYAVTALFEKGSDEDSAVVMPLDAARRLLHMNGVSAVLLNADTDHLQEAEKAIRAAWPDLQVKTLRQVAVAEERVLGRIQLLMLLVTAVVLLSSVIALGSTMGANVIERLEEIGLMKAIGATRDDIRRFFMSEAALAGVVGGCAGYVLGVAAAEMISRTAFGSFIPVSLFVAPCIVVLGVCIAAFATYLPVRDAMKVVPARILRGE